MPAIVRRSF